MSTFPHFLHIGFIGAGGIARLRHLPALSRRPDIRLTAVCNRTPASAGGVASEFGFARVTDNWHQIIDDPDIDAIFIGTWPYMHAELSIAALQAGKHVFCQARMAMNLDEAKRMCAAAQARPDLVSMICPPPQRMPYEAYIHQLLESGSFGQIHLVELHSITADNRDANHISWRERAELSGRQILAAGIYAEVLNAWLGPYEELSAQLTTPIGTKRNSDGRDVPVTVPQTVTITGRLTNSGALINETHTGLAADRTTLGASLTVWGLDGTLRYDFTSGRLELARAGEIFMPVEIPAEYHKPWRVEDDFIDAVHAARRGDAWQVRPDFAEGLLYMRKIEAIHLAARTGRAVEPAKL